MKCDLTAVLKAACCPDSALYKRKERGSGTSCSMTGPAGGKKKERDGQVDTLRGKQSHIPANITDEHLSDAQPCPSRNIG